MRRKLLFAERMLHGNGLEPFNVVSPIKIRGSFPAENLVHALKRLQFKHPLLNASIQTDAKQMPWFVAGENNHRIPVRVAERLTSEDWQMEAVKEWSVPFKTTTEPLMRVVWLKGEEFSELLLVSHHCLCDGGSILSIIQELLLLLDDGSVNIGKEKPILSVNDIVPQRVLKNKKKVIKARLIGKAATFILWLVPVKKQLTERKKDYMINWKLDRSVSDQLILNCKSAGVTVNTALCVAVLEAFKAVRKEAFHNKISCPVDIRKFAPEIKKDNIFAFGLMFVVSAVQEAVDFFSKARKMQIDIDKKTEKLDAYETIMMMEASHSSLKNFTDFLKYGKSSNDCMFSNLGRIAIPSIYRLFTVETIYSPSVIGPLGNTTTLITSTYKEQMDFTFISSEGFIPWQQGISIRDKIIEILTAQVSNDIKNV